MLELSDSAPEVDVQASEYHRLLGFPPRYEAAGRVQELVEWARCWYREHGRPWWYAQQVQGEALGDASVMIGGTTFRSPRLHGLLRRAEARSAILVAVSAGQECEAHARTLWDEGKPDEYFFLEVFGSAVVEALVATASYRLCEWADEQSLAVLPHYSPGYPEWDISDQQGLFSELAAGCGFALTDRLRVLSTGMLAPKKSLLAVFGLTAEVQRVTRLTSLAPCEHCSLPGCRYRRLPYRRPLPQIEGQRRGMRGTSGAALSPNAHYSVSTAALEKWSQQRLHVRVHSDRSVEARFRYEGTTCSNLGQSLTFDYHVRLSSAERGYTIVDARCEPASGTDGHTCMCEYLTDPERLLGAIADEPPLVGRPLEAVLDWRPDYDPAGCYCTPTARTHKWAVVLEVLHFALARSGSRGAMLTSEAS